MKLHFKIYLDAFAITTLNNVSIGFQHIENHVDWDEQPSDELSLNISGGSKEITFEYLSGVIVTHSSNFEDLSTNGSYIEFDGDFWFGISDLLKFVNNGIIEISPIGDSVLVYLYTQNSENNALTKTLTLVNVLAGKFNSAFNVKNPILDFKYTDGDNVICNYMFIPSLLNRYYFVESVDIISADFIRYKLREDVLMTWKILITQQSALVVRSESNDSKNLLIDDRLPLEDRKSHVYYTNLVHGSLKNVTLNYDLTSDYNFMITSITSVSTNVCNDVTPPSSSGLPTISSHLTEHDCVRFADKNTIGKLLVACYNDDATASYINSVLWLPFNPISVFDAHTSASTAIYAGDKALNNTSQWVSASGTFTPATCYYTWMGTSPYLVVADFTFNNAGGINESNTILNNQAYWEIYVAFVGWVEIPFAKVTNKRILVYYSLDFKTGISTAYIYNYTDKVVIYSTTCTLGIQIDVSTTNRLENTRQKQANDLNMLMSTLTSVASIGVGVATENPVAITGGLLSFGKAVTGYVNARNMIYDRANTSFGTSDGALHSPLDVIVRKTYHAPITIDASTFAHINGYPTNKYGTLSSFSGHTEVGEIHFDPKNNLISQDEINEIVALLKDGVVI